MVTDRAELVWEQSGLRVGLTRYQEKAHVDVRNGLSTYESAVIMPVEKVLFAAEDVGEDHVSDLSWKAKKR